MFRYLITPCSYNFQLYARQLNETITYMYKNKRYNQMVLYIEACYSGSMFHEVLSPSIQDVMCKLWMNFPISHNMVARSVVS
ncbi:hypothetical protein PHET_04416 [Paragonimus heterotremus]|uniref:Legumain n=1 Tax=Paragonimus heterotremus TaxID=100268 RepID=A0A8J4T205_9TREM|nr:hypothetical protein PHET_04416 [Paragonimus heterotremus]